MPSFQYLAAEVHTPYIYMSNQFLSDTGVTKIGFLDIGIFWYWFWWEPSNQLEIAWSNAIDVVVNVLS